MFSLTNARIRPNGKEAPVPKTDCDWVNVAVANVLNDSNAASTEENPTAAEIIAAPIYWYFVLFLSSIKFALTKPVCSPSSFISVPNPGLLKDKLGASKVYLLFFNCWFWYGGKRKFPSLIWDFFFICLVLIKSFDLLSLKGKLGKSTLFVVL